MISCIHSKLQFQPSLIYCDAKVEYADDVSDIFAFHGLRHQLFADEMQGYCSGHSDDVHAMASRIERCVSDVSD